MVSIHILFTSVVSALLRRVVIFSFFFFFQAEDGIRDLTVTGVQTCALPICIAPLPSPQALAGGQVAHIHTEHLHLALARLLSVREVIGLRNPGHSVVKLLAPCDGPCLLVTAYTHPEYLPMLHGTFGTLGMNVLLSRGLEGEVAADPRRLPRYDGFVAGAHQLLAEQQSGTASDVPGRPASTSSV